MREVLITVAAFFLFAAVHSTCAADRVKQWNAGLFGKTFVQKYFRFLYMVLSLGTTLGCFAWIRSLPDVELFRLPTALAYFFRLIQLGALAFILSCFEVINFREFSGFTQVLHPETDEAQRRDLEGIRHRPIERKGPYRYMRHPMYAGALLIFVFSPDYSRNWLAVRVLAILYLFYGMWIEERRLVERYGEEYRSYQRDVPPLIPRIGPKTSS
ncbi:MAG: methyltransferase family protein [Thermodesulfobacteriota bacterium]